MNNNPDFNDAVQSCLGSQMSTLPPAGLTKTTVAQLDRLYDSLVEITESDRREFLPPVLLHSLDVGTILLGEWLDRHLQPPPQ